MKKSELKAYIRENIIETLSEEEQIPNAKEVEATTKALADLNKELAKSKELQKEEDASDAVDYDDYVDIGRGYLDGFRKPHSLNDDELEVLGRKVTKQLYKGDIDKAYQDLVLRTRLKEEEDDDKDAIKAAEKARGKNKKYDIVLTQLKDVETEMRSLAREYSKADGAKKEELLKKLKDLTGRKNELKKEVDKYADALV